MKILVTGANGYLGSGVVKKLCDVGANVIAVSRSEIDNIDSRAKIIRKDIFMSDNPYEELCEPDVLLHMSWENGFVHNDMSHINNLPKHVQFIDKIANSSIKKIAVIGSMHEVGFHEGSINENTPTNPESFYGISKNALRSITELICKNNGIIFQWLRGFYIVGNSLKGCSIFSKICLAEANKQKIFPFTTGVNQWDFIDYTEFCEQVAVAILQDNVDGIINICSGKPERLSDRVERFIKENKFNIKLDYGAFPDRPYDSKAVWGDNTKIIKIINQNPNYWQLLR